MATHWKSLTDRDYIYAFDLDGRDVVVKISRVVGGELTSAGGRKTKKPIVYFEGKTKGLALNATNAKTIAALYGNYIEKWVGREITLYPTTTQMGGETMECIRIRPAIPKRASSSKRQATPVIDRTDLDQAANGSTEITDDEAAEIARLEANGDAE